VGVIVDGDGDGDVAVVGDRRAPTRHSPSSPIGHVAVAVAVKVNDHVDDHEAS
jgi:hypothetical protein